MTTWCKYVHRMHNRPLSMIQLYTPKSLARLKMGLFQWLNKPLINPHFVNRESHLLHQVSLHGERTKLEQLELPEEIEWLAWHLCHRKFAVANKSSFNRLLSYGLMCTHYFVLTSESRNLSIKIGVRVTPLEDMKFEHFSTLYDNLRLTNTGKALMVDLGFPKDNASIASCSDQAGLLHESFAPRQAFLSSNKPTQKNISIFLLHAFCPAEAVEKRPM